MSEVLSPKGKVMIVGDGNCVFSQKRSDGSCVSPGEKVICGGASSKKRSHGGGSFTRKGVVAKVCSPTRASDGGGVFLNTAGDGPGVFSKQEE